MKTSRTKEEDILLWCGVVSQLVRTRSNQILRSEPLAYPLFVLLRHFCHNPKQAWTITELTRAFETKQPGMTKKVQRLSELGYIDMAEDEQDARKKWYRVNPQGLRVKQQMVQLLRHDQAITFKDWSDKDKDRLHRYLFQLKSHLDENRDGLVLPKPSSSLTR
ncbi:MAG: winged helix-turn-helix transcriptional regulator [Gammaproteobacteria bacterium]|nr:winged helix-turn-helix transcriptional regulator [Gammaproteobacteria bacterium]